MKRIKENKSGEYIKMNVKIEVNKLSKMDKTKTMVKVISQSCPSTTLTINK